MRMPNGYHQNVRVPHSDKQNDDAASPRRVVWVAGVSRIGAGVASAMGTITVGERLIRPRVARTPGVRITF